MEDDTHCHGGGNQISESAHIDIFVLLFYYSGGHIGLVVILVANELFCGQHLTAVTNQPAASII